MFDVILPFYVAIWKTVIIIYLRFYTAKVVFFIEFSRIYYICLKGKKKTLRGQLTLSVF